MLVLWGNLEITLESLVLYTKRSVLEMAVNRSSHYLVTLLLNRPIFLNVLKLASYKTQTCHSSNKTKNFSLPKSALNTARRKQMPESNCSDREKEGKCIKFLWGAVCVLDFSRYYHMPQIFHAIAIFRHRMHSHQPGRLGAALRVSRVHSNDCFSRYNFVNDLQICISHKQASKWKKIAERNLFSSRHESGKCAVFIIELGCTAKASASKHTIMLGKCTSNVINISPIHRIKKLSQIVCN